MDGRTDGRMDVLTAALSSCTLCDALETFTYCEGMPHYVTVAVV